MAQQNVFEKLKSFTPIQSLSAQDLRGLEPEDVQFVVNAQMMGNSQQQQMFSQALSYMQLQQQRIDQAKTSVAKAEAAQKLEKTKATLKMLNDNLEMQRKRLLDRAKSGDKIAEEKAKTVLKLELEEYKRKVPVAKHPEELAKLDAQARKAEAELRQIEEGTMGGLTPYQSAMMGQRESKAQRDRMMDILNPEVPPTQKQYLAGELNTPNSTIYHHYQPPVEDTAWLGNNAVEEEYREIELPPNPKDNSPVTVQDVYELADELNITVLEAINALKRQYEKNQQK